MSKADNIPNWWFKLFLLAIKSSVFISKFYMLKSSYKKRYDLKKTMPSAQPVIFPFDYFLNDYERLYLIRGSDILISQFKDEILIEAVCFESQNNVIDLEYILENYPEEICQDFLFNINLFLKEK